MKSILVLGLLLLLTPLASAEDDWLHVQANSILVPNLADASNSYTQRADGAPANEGQFCQFAEFDPRASEGGFKVWEAQATTGCISVWLDFIVPPHATTMDVRFEISRGFVTEGKWEAPNYEQLVAVYQAGNQTGEAQLFGLQSEPTMGLVPAVERFEVTPGPATVEWWFRDAGVGAPMVGDVALPASGFQYSSDVRKIALVFPGLETQLDRPSDTAAIGSVVGSARDDRTLTIPPMSGGATAEIKLQFPSSKNLGDVRTPDGRILDTEAWESRHLHGVTEVLVPAGEMDGPGAYELSFASATSYAQNSIMMAYTIAFALAVGSVATWTGFSFRRVGPTLAEHSSPMFRYAIFAFIALFLLGIGVVIWVTARAAWPTFAATPVSVEVLVTTVYMGSTIFALVMLRQVMVAAYHTGVKQFELESSNRDLDQFSHIVTHDLRAPLRSVSAFTGLLRRKYAKSLDDEALEYIDLAQGGAARMSKLLDAIGEYARVGRGKRAFETVSLTELVDDVKKDLHADLSQSGARIVATGLPALSCDPALLREALLNLVQNAVKFKHPKRRPVIQIRGHKGPLGALITVQDNGLGMEETVVKSIFEPFQRVQATGGIEGTGMGLAICRRIAERHGGHIDVESTLGKGTTFILHLPNA